MLNKIIQKLELGKEYKDQIYVNALNYAISIIKKHEKENSNRVDKVLRISPSREQIAMVNDEGITEIFIRQDVVISQYQQHPLSDEDIERAANKYAFENNTHRSNSKAFIAGANFAKQPHSNESNYPIEFIMWYSGQPSDKINKAYQRYLNELPQPPKK